MDSAESVLEFLRENGYWEAEGALREEIDERDGDIGCFEFERFVFPMDRALPPVRVPVSFGRRMAGEAGGGGGDLSDEDDEEFVSLVSSRDDDNDGGCSSEFTNPYGRHLTSKLQSDASSDRVSQFGTARDYHDFDLQTDLWFGEKDEGYYFSPISGPDSFRCQSQDKFVTEADDKTKISPFHTEHIFEELHPQDNVNNQLSRVIPTIKNYGHEKDYHVDDNMINHDQGDYRDISEGLNTSDSLDSKGAILNKYRPMFMSTHVDDYPLKKEVEKHLSLFSNAEDSLQELAGSETYNTAEQDLLLYNGYDNDNSDCKEVVGGLQEARAGADEQEGTVAEELPILESSEDEYDVFDLRIVHQKNRTGFEENKDLPILINTLIAGRYLITEYLGSATFSRVVQAHDVQTGVEVCLKIIKNDKDFFDQSLDEIKLLKYVNKHDPSDEKHILRLYDYFYHQEHLFIVCELLRANMYEFQKYNAESGGEPYFTMNRLQAITRQCLEAMAFLHQLGVIHCDLKPENMLIRSYSRCEIKIIDLGSSCFQTDNLCPYVQSRSYRAPEVILGLPYGPKIDVWSLGCILVELCSGEVLFPNDAVALLLARMIGMLGPIDLEMLLRGKETHKYFTKEYDLYYIHEGTDQVEYIVPEMAFLEHQLSVSDDELIDFIKSLLLINPERRPTAEEALRHPWLSKHY